MRVSSKVMCGSCVFLLSGYLSLALTAQDSAKIQTVDPSDHALVPSCLDCPPPDYSPEAQKAKIETVSVVLEVIVTEMGRVRDARVIRDPGYGLGKRAKEAVKKWKLKPAIGPNGKPVVVKTMIEVRFKSP